VAACGFLDRYVYSSGNFCEPVVMLITTRGLF